jgi:hypothetical protein
VFTCELYNIASLNGVIKWIALQVTFARFQVQIFSPTMDHPDWGFLFCMVLISNSWASHVWPFSQACLRLLAWTLNIHISDLLFVMTCRDWKQSCLWCQSQTNLKAQRGWATTNSKQHRTAPCCVVSLKCLLLRHVYSHNYHSSYSSYILNS